MPIINCLVCGKEKYAKLYHVKRGWGKYCSRKCYYISKIGKTNPSKGKNRPEMVGNTNGFKKGQDTWNKGTKGICKSNSGSFKKGIVPWNKNLKGFMANEKNAGWKGNNVGYFSLHAWVNRYLGKPTKCEHCGKDGLTGHQIQWANTNHKYKRNLKDWIRLCAMCHQKYDIKFN
jgi:hypothetical protein